MKRPMIRIDERQARGKKIWYYQCAAYSEHLAVLLVEFWKDTLEDAKSIGSDADSLEPRFCN
ncbi:MAG: hypothetical protein NC924_02085 [Candidatus Omnitrophica bacterium]|nr:hypothetical protein [Candidatus Omnitrophota bacterium]